MSRAAPIETSARSMWWVSMRELLRIRGRWPYLTIAVFAIWSLALLVGSGHFAQGFVALSALLINAVFVSYIHERTWSLDAGLNVLRAPKRNRAVFRCAVWLVTFAVLLFVVGMLIAQFSIAWVLLASCWVLVLGSWPAFRHFGVFLHWLVVFIAMKSRGLAIEPAVDGPAFWLLLVLGLFFLVRNMLRLRQWRRHGRQAAPHSDQSAGLIPARSERLQPVPLSKPTDQVTKDLALTDIEAADQSPAFSTPADRELHQILAQTADKSRRFGALVFVSTFRLTIFQIVAMVLAFAAFAAWELLLSTRPDPVVVAMSIAPVLFIAAIMGAENIVSQAADRGGPGFELMQLPGFPDEKHLVRQVVRRVAQWLLAISGVAVLACVVVWPILLLRQDLEWQSIMVTQGRTLTLALACTLFMVGTHLAMWVTWPYRKGFRVVASLGITVFVLGLIGLIASAFDNRNLSLVLLVIASAAPWLCIKPQHGRATRLIRDLPRPEKVY